MHTMKINAEEVNETKIFTNFYLPKHKRSICEQLSIAPSAFHSVISYVIQIQLVIYVSLSFMVYNLHTIRYWQTKRRSTVMQITKFFFYLNPHKAVRWKRKRDTSKHRYQRPDTIPSNQLPCTRHCIKHFI